MESKFVFDGKLYDLSVMTDKEILCLKLELENRRNDLFTQIQQESIIEGGN